MLHVGELLHGRYQLIRQINNAHYQKWLAVDISTLHQQVILKAASSATPVGQEIVERLQYEARILNSCKHPSLPKFIDYFSLEQDHVWFILVYVYAPGSSLQDLEDQGLVSDRIVISTIVSTLQVLDVIHDYELKFFHGGIKASNIIIDSNNNIILTDCASVYFKNGVNNDSVNYQILDLNSLGTTLVLLINDTQKNCSEISVGKTWTTDFAQWVNELASPTTSFSSSKVALSEFLKLKVISKPVFSKQKAETNLSSQDGLQLNDSTCNTEFNVQQWNWGAFLLGPVWALGNQVWIGTIGFVPILLLGTAFLIATALISVAPGVSGVIIFWIGSWSGLILILSCAFYLISMVLLGSEGNNLALKDMDRDSAEKFVSRQPYWTIAGVILGIPILGIICTGIYLIIFAFASAG
jgi:tRNA A-37 threonylcarbamoyl transferase component Bud32